LAGRKLQRAVLLVGAGRMGGALIKGWLAAKHFAQIHVVEPAPSEALKALAKNKKITIYRDLPAKLPRVSAIVLAIKPQVLKAEGNVLAALGKPKVLVLSIAAGIGTALLRARLSSSSPLVRAMPNTPGAIGRGITTLFAGSKLSAEERALAEQLTASLGETLWLEDEALMDAVTALSGSGPAYVFLLAEAMAAAGRAEGLDPATADKLARTTIAGSGALLAADRRPASELRQEVTSPGGTTEAALRLLMAPDGLEALMRRAIAAATARGKELGKT